MTYRNYRTVIKKQIRLYVAVVSESQGENTFKLLDEIERLRHLVARINRMNMSELLRPIPTHTYQRESIINDPNFKL